MKPYLNLFSWMSLFPHQPNSCGDASCPSQGSSQDDRPFPWTQEQESSQDSNDSRHSDEDDLPAAGRKGAGKERKAKESRRKADWRSSDSEDEGTVAKRAKVAKPSLTVERTTDDAGEEKVPSSQGEEEDDEEVATRRTKPKPPQPFDTNALDEDTPVGSSIMVIIEKQ